MYLTFLKVADSGSFSKASKILFISPVSVMKQMNTLENQLGIRLLNRNPRGINLTPAGERLYTGVSKIIQDSTDMLEQVQQIVTTMLRWKVLQRRLEQALIVSLDRVIPTGGTIITMFSN